MSSFHDHGTVRIYETADGFEVFSPRFDLATREVLRSLKAYFDGARRSWRVVPRYTRSKPEDVLIRLQKGLEDAAPEGWLAKVAAMSKMRTTTRRFSLSIGLGGIRVEVPPGHKHEWTLKNLDKQKMAERDGVSYLVPAAYCTNAAVVDVLKTIAEDDRSALATAVDYLEEFTLRGELSLAPEEVEMFGLNQAANSIVFAEPSFVRAADGSIPSEPIDAYPLRLLMFKPAEGGGEAKFAFITGIDAWKIIRQRNAGDMPGKALASRQCKGHWARRRG
jgi:hypothetical protein